MIIRCELNYDRNPILGKGKKYNCRVHDKYVNNGRKIYMEFILSVQVCHSPSMICIRVIFDLPSLL